MAPAVEPAAPPHQEEPAAAAAKGGGGEVPLPPNSSPPPRSSPADRYERRIRRAKRAARSELSVSKGEWTRHAHSSNPALASTAGVVDTVPRVRLADLKPGEFASRFERPRLPVVLTDAADAWPCPPGHALWTPAGLQAALGSARLKVGSDDDGYAVRLAFDDFLDYAADPGHGRADDSPLYVFDGGFADSDTSSSSSSSDDGGPRRRRRRKRVAGPGAAIRAAYAIPPPFSEDLLAAAGARRRPPHRWLVVGPPRSGSGLHVDPLATAAWNTLLAGRKRWALFPPGTPAALVAPREAGLGREAADWFAAVYPRTRRPDWPGPPVMDLVQEAGETVYVPGGWWHAVLNLPSSSSSNDGRGAGAPAADPDLAIAVTQNFCSTANFARVWPAAAVGRPRMAAAWLRALAARGRHDLVAAAAASTAGGLDGVSASSSSDSSSSSSSSESEDDGRSRPVEA